MLKSELENMLDDVVAEYASLPKRDRAELVESLIEFIVAELDYQFEEEDQGLPSADDYE